MSHPSHHLSGMLGLATVNAIISVVDHHTVLLLSDPLTRNALHLKCRARHEPSPGPSPRSDLHLGIRALESAIRAFDDPVERNYHLSVSERVLQNPALLEEEGSTAGVPNRDIVCRSHFYLSLVRRLRGDRWQMTVHFMRAALVYPSCVGTELAPGLWGNLFGSDGTDFDAAGRRARMYKECLMYYQVISYGDPCYRNSASDDCCNQPPSWPALDKAKMVYPSNIKEDAKGTQAKALSSNMERGSCTDSNNDSFDMRCLQDMLEDSQSDTSVSFYSPIDPNGESVCEEEISAKDLSPNADIKDGNRKILPLPSRSISSVDTLTYSSLDFRDAKTNPLSNYYIKEDLHEWRSPKREFRCFSNLRSNLFRKHCFNELVHHGRSARWKLNLSGVDKNLSEESSNHDKNNNTIEPLKTFENAVSALRFREGRDRFDDSDADVHSFKREILDQLLHIISTSTEEKDLRASLSTILFLISEDKTIIEKITRRKDLHLCTLASALKSNVHEAAILIYLLKPPPTEIKKLELLPTLVDVACDYKARNGTSMILPLTPASASIAMIEVLVTAFDYATNNMHLAVISSPQVLAKLVNVALNKDLEEGAVLAAILAKCMRLNGDCRKFLSQITPVDPFLGLLRSNERKSVFAALEYFHENLRMPRSSAIHLLHQIRQQGDAGIMSTLMTCVQEYEEEHRILAANLLLQLDMLRGSNSKSGFREVAMRVLLESVALEENPSMQSLSAFVLSNLGGTFSWTGESYTAAWLVKKAGLTSASQRNLIRNVDWSDPCLQESETDSWSARVARCVIKTGISAFQALASGARSKTKSVSRDCLVCVAWLGSEMAVLGLSNLRFSACETVLSDIAHFLHPGSDLDERVLACLCVYNYTSGKGKQKLMSFSEGFRESLRRLSGVTWMAEELLQVTDFFLPKPRVSCVHTQVLEVGHVGVAAASATALIFYKGQLFAGYSDGSIKVWEIKGQRGMLMWEFKEHTRPVTCFTLFEQGDNLLSGSSDKTIRVWKRIRGNFECVEVINMKEPVQKIDTFGCKILVVTENRGLKVHDSSRNIETFCKDKHVKCFAVAQGKIYVSCSDSSIQEVDILGGHITEIRGPSSRWRMHKNAINSIIVYKGWVYCAGASVEGSSIKDWRRWRRSQVEMKMDRGTQVQTMAVVEDFMYLNCSSSPSIIQVWLRGQQQKIGRLSAGSKITSLLTANDIVLCGTQTGLIKGWIPL